MSDGDPIIFRPRGSGAPSPAVGSSHTAQKSAATVAFDRRELSEILRVYGRKVAEGEWRDYALDFGRDTAVFSIFRRSSEWPLYRIEKTPRNARKQGAYSVITATGLILRRGHDLRRVLEVIDKRRLELVQG